MTYVKSNQTRGWERLAYGGSHERKRLLEKQEAGPQVYAAACGHLQISTGAVLGVSTLVARLLRSSLARPRPPCKDMMWSQPLALALMEVNDVQALSVE